MKKILILILITVLAAPLTALAASIGGADTQGRGKFAVGIDSDYVFYKEFKNRNIMSSLPGGFFGGGISTEIKGGMYREMVKLSYGVLDNLDIYVKAGTAQIIGIRQNAEMPGAFGGFNIAITRGADYSSELGQAYAAGLKGKINLPGKLSNWLAGIDAQYLRQRNRTRLWIWQNMYILGALAVHAEMGGRGYIVWEEWQAAPYLAYKFKYFTPYVGAKYSYTRMKIQTDERIDFGFNERTGSRAGVFTGLDWNITQHITLNVEGRFIDETAVSGAVAYKF